LCFGQWCIYKVHNKKENIGSKGPAKDKHEIQGRLFGYVAQNIQRINASFISSNMHMLMWFQTRIKASSRDAT